MLRIRFTERDLTHVVLGSSDHSEALGSVVALRAPSLANVNGNVFGSPALDAWRRSAERRLTREMRPLFDVVRATGAVPDFLAPDEVTGAVADAPGESPVAMRALRAAARAYHDACVAPVLPTVRAAIRAEVGRQTLTLADSGLRAVLGGLGPVARWTHPELHVVGLQGYVDLGGRGLRLVPSVMWPRAAFVERGYRTPTLVYPIQPLPAPTPITEPSAALAALLGRTRAAVLASLAAPCGTATLAERVGVSTSNASEHATALRAAGLVATRRHGRSVRHRLTDLGERLLTTDPVPPRSDRP